MLKQGMVSTELLSLPRQKIQTSFVRLFIRVVCPAPPLDLLSLAGVESKAAPLLAIRHTAIVIFVNAVTRLAC